MRAHVLATGPSLTQAVVDKVFAERGDEDVILAVNDAIFLAPDADALVAQDVAWLQHHSRALAEIKTLKLSSHRFAGAIPLDCPVDGTGMNSGGFAIFAAVARFGATEIFLHGFDMQGAHFFGHHVGRGLRNTTPDRRVTFQWQFAELRKYLEARGVSVVNLTPDSKLEAFPWQG